MSSGRKKDLLCAVIIFFAAFLFLSPAFIFPRVLLPSDALQFELPWKSAAPSDATFNNNHIEDAVVQSYPWRLHTMCMLRNGVVPLWNPWQFSGAPHAANSQSAVFYAPGNAIYAVFGVARGLAVAALIHLWLAGFGIFLFLRHQRVARIPALFSGLAFPFSGWFVVWLSRPEFIHTAAWLPWVFLSLAIINRTKSWIHCALGAVFIAAIFLAGHTQIALYNLAAAFLYSIFLYFVPVNDTSVFSSSIKRKRKLISIAAFPVMLLCGVAVASVQLVLIVEFFSHASRAEVASRVLHKSFVQALAPYVHLLIPDFFGNPIHNNVLGGYNYAETCAYSSIIVVLLATLSWFVRKTNRHIAFFIILAIMSLLIASGSPLYSLILRIAPMFNIFSNGRMSLLFCFSIAALSGFTIDAVIRGLRIKPIAILSVASAFIIACYLLIISNIAIHNEFHGPYIFELIKIGAIRFVVFLIVSVAVLLAFIWNSNKSIYISMALFALFAVDIASWGFKFNTYSPIETVFPNTKLVEFLRADLARPFRIHSYSAGHIFPPDTATAEMFEDDRGYDSLIFTPYRNLIRAFQEQRGGGTFVNGPWLSYTAFNPTLLKLLNVKYVLHTRDVSSLRPEFTNPHQIDGAWIYLYRDRLPRAWSVRSWAKAKSHDDALRIVTNPNFDPAVSVVLEHPPRFISDKMNKSIRMNDNIAFLSRSPRDPSYRVDTSRRAIVVFSEIAYPGWRMYINGTPHPWQRANYTFRAVALDPGSFKIEFHYRPPQAARATLIGIFTMAFLSVALMYSLIKKTSLKASAQI